VNDLYQLIPLADLLTSHTNDAIALLQASLLCRHLVADPAHHRSDGFGNADDHGADGKDQHGQEYVEERTSGNHQRTNPNRFGHELPGLTFDAGGVHAFIDHAGQFDIAAKGRGGNAIVGVTDLLAEKPRRVADGKALDANAGQFGQQKMAKLVNKDEQAEDKEERDEIAGKNISC